MINTKGEGTKSLLGPYRLTKINPLFQFSSEQQTTRHLRWIHSLVTPAEWAAELCEHLCPCALLECRLHFTVSLYFVNEPFHASQLMRVLSCAVSDNWLSSGPLHDPSNDADDPSFSVTKGHPEENKFIRCKGKCGNQCCLHKFDFKAPRVSSLQAGIEREISVPSFCTSNLISFSWRSKRDLRGVGIIIKSIFMFYMLVKQTWDICVINWMCDYCGNWQEKRSKGEVKDVSHALWPKADILGGSMKRGCWDGESRVQHRLCEEWCEQLC